MVETVALPEVEQFIIFNPEGELHPAQCLNVGGEGGEPKFIVEDLGVILPPVRRA